MSKMKVILILILLTFSPLIMTQTNKGENGENLRKRDIITTKLNQSISQTGSLSFVLKTDKTYQNGQGQKNYMQHLLQLTGLADISFVRSDQSINFYFLWQQKNRNDRCFDIQFEEISGPEEYHFLFTWDAKKGYFDGYFNGVPQRVPGTLFKPWKISGKSTELRKREGRILLTDIEATPGYLNQNQVTKIIAEKFLNRQKLLVSFNTTNLPDILKRKGKLLYEVKLSKREDVSDWILEGPGQIVFKTQKMVLSSKKQNSDSNIKNHFNLWCPKTFPGSFIAEWNYEQISEYGFSIIFFAARGINGEDIFDPGLEKRDGTFRQYVNGKINNYYIGFYANLPLYQTGRIYGNLRKNNKFYIVKQGPIAIEPKAKGFYKLTLIKDRNHIQLLVNQKKVAVDFIDSDFSRFGPAYKEGKIGFRQMGITKGAYKNFRVWALKK